MYMYVYIHTYIHTHTHTHTHMYICTSITRLTSESATSRRSST